MAVEYSAPQAYYIVKARCSKKSKRRKDAKKINETIIEEDPSNKNRPLFALQVDERSRVFVMDMVPKVAEFLEVGTVDLITEEVKTYLTRLHGGPEIGINIRLKYNKNLDCPVLESSFAILDHNERNASFTSILIYALTGNLQDILQVLLRAEIPNVELQFVDDKYIAEVKEFLSNSPHLRKLCIGNHYLKKDQHLVHDIMKSSKSLSTLHFSRKNMSWSQRNQVCNTSLNDYMRYIFEIKSLERLDLIQITGLFTDHVESLAEG
ncbi:unnamed protein product [Cylindrotheca closterium]|uniref:Uncharacterized protein n=1 Tax=Cylindrotheca closterium TaxID=2856 RepID=A0AAD2FEM9_9STRA|nr:unnamed protein product [Cylindrotheca closterium]